LDLQQMLLWLQRLASLDTRVFDEVRSSPSATLPGVIVAAGATLLAGIGGWLWWMISDFPQSSDILVHSAILGSVIAVVLWGVLWVGLVYVMLTQVFRERAYLEQLLRVMGLALTPLALMLFMFIPAIELAVGMAALVMAFGMTNIALQTVTTANPGRVLASNAVGFFGWAAVLTLLAASDGSTLNPHAPGVFLFNTTHSITEGFFELAGQLKDIVG
jgi:hypothetical protein